jgi:uncharacterized protein (DUF1015 family)
MATLKPFRGLRPSSEIAPKMACPPYDVVSTEEARRYAAGNSCCFFHISRPEIGPLHGSEHETAARNLQRFRDNGWLRQDDSPTLYIYRQNMGQHEQTGVVAAVSVDEYDRGLIKKHELTRPDKEDERTQHIAALSANDESVFLTYRAKRTIGALIAELTRAQPEYDFVTEDGVAHTFWVASPQSCDAIVDAFRTVAVLYIADGHHRIAAASRVKKLLGDRASHFLAAIFPHDQIQILSYNRVARDLNGLDCDGLLQSVSRNFFIAPTPNKAPASSGNFSMYVDGKWYALRPKNSSAALDVSVLQEQLLSPILGIGDPRIDSRIQFIGGIRGTEELERMVDSREYAVAFSLFPTRLEQLFATADAGTIMPPKSTWFEPKLRSGLILHPYD